MQSRPPATDSSVNDFDETLLKDPTSLLSSADGAQNPNGFIAATIFMAWPKQRNIRRFNLEVKAKNVIHRFDVEFSGVCVEYLDQLALTVQDKILLALKGAKVQKKPPSGGPGALPICLKYPEGAVIKVTSRRDASKPSGQIIDIWKLRSEQAQRPDDWWSTPVVTNWPISESASKAQPTSDVTVLSGEDTKPVVAILPSSVPLSLADPAQANEVAAKTSASLTVSNDKPIKRKAVDESRVPLSSLVVASDFKVAPAVSASSIVSHDNRPKRKAENVPLPIDEQRRAKQPKLTKDKQDFDTPVDKAKSHTVLTEGAGLPQASPDEDSEPAPNVPQLSKRKAKLLAKAQKRQLAKEGKNQAVASVSPDTGQVLNNADPASTRIQISSKAPRISDITLASTSTRSPPPVASTSDNHHELANLFNDQGEAVIKNSTKPAEQWFSEYSQGFHIEDGDTVVPFSKVDSQKFINLIGVVTSVNPTKQTKNGDWSCSVMLCDPSNFGGFGDGFRVNCFTRRYKGWLPQAERGQILILHKVKPEVFNGSVGGVGHVNRLQWARFDPETGLACLIDLAEGESEADGLANGYGYVFSPFWKPFPSELRYCTRLAAWWKEKTKEQEKSLGSVYNIGDASFASTSGARISRQHRLISEAGPDVPPKGFFKCTVEILHAHTNDNGVYSVYVTDYTKPQGVHPVQAAWCPPELADYVLKVEMWEAAAQLAREMLVGDYYYFNNNRMKIGSGEYAEATMSETERVCKLDPRDAEKTPHLAALLRRKKEWEEKTGASTSVANPFSHELLKDGVDNTFFDCTIEVLQTVQTTEGSGCIYVTDYTHNADFANASDPHTVSHGLEGYILKILLWEGQAEVAKEIEPGSFYSIKKLRTKRSYRGKEIQGRLGGTERLIYRLNARNTDNDHLKALLLRKENLVKQISAGSNASEMVVAVAKDLPPESKPRATLGTTIKEIRKADHLPQQYRLVARVVDFHPLTLDESLILRCTKCWKVIPSNRKGCLDCDDMVTSHAKWFFRLRLEIEDEQGDKLFVRVLTGENTLLDSLAATDPRVHPDVIRHLETRLKPVLGNLMAVHEGYKRNEEVRVDTPLMEWVILCWREPGVEGSSSYVDHGVWRCEELRQ